MPTAAELARAHYRRQQAISRQVADLLRALWSTVDAGDVITSWTLVSQRATETVALGQYASARAALAFVPTAITAQGGDGAALAEIDPRALAGTAADGRPLSSLLTGGAFRARALLAGGSPVDEAMASGLARLLLAGTNEVVQAGISGASAQIGATPTATGYTRVLAPPSCSRCIVLAGRFFRHNAGFARHPHCDCVHLPAIEDLSDEVVSPEAAFASMTAAQQDATFTRAGAEAIRNGADIGRVVNARLSTYVPTGRRTPRGTPTKRTVEDLLAMAGEDRARFVALLGSAGYLR